MKKSEVIEKIIENVKEISCYIVRIYGVSCGVGYDMNVELTFKNGLTEHQDVHAIRQSWACFGHLRPNNPRYQYTGNCDYYQEKVIKYWENGNGFKELITRMNKEELIEKLDYVTLDFTK